MYEDVTTIYTSAPIPGRVAETSTEKFDAILKSFLGVTS